MKFIFGQLLLVLVLFKNLAADPVPADFPAQFKLLPQPQKIEMLPGGNLPYTTVKGIYLQGAATKPVLYGLLKNIPLAANAGKEIITLTITQDNQVPAAPESYLLQVTPNGINISARDQAGLFYGCQTLNQLLEDARDQNIAIPAVKITDFPEVAYRSVHLDLKHHLDAGHYYYDMIDRLAQVKVNAIIVEFEDKLRYRGAPVVGASHAISIEEFAAISRYAQERNIQISPLVQGLGHASFILKHDQYKPLRDDAQSDWAFDPLNPRTYELQFSLYDDALAATPSGKYLHIGGDEVGKLGVSELAKKSGKSPLELQMYWLGKVTEYARQHNRIPIFWDDMLFKLSGVYETTHNERMPKQRIDSIWQAKQSQLTQNLPLFPKECVYMRWNYKTPDIYGNKKAIDWYKQNNLKVMAATAAQTMWPMLPRENSNLESIKDFSRIAAEKKMDGILCTVWDDCSPHHETVWRGLYNFALFSWNHEDLSADAVNALYRHRFYGPALSSASFEFQNNLEDALVFWEKALLDKGYRNNYPQDIDLIELPDARKNGDWSKQYQEKINKAQAEVQRYNQIKETIAKAQTAAIRNTYNLALFNQMNELQIYPAKLLLLLAEYDKTKVARQKKEAAQQVQQYVNNFPVLRKQYEEVFSKTRFLQNPAGYQLDQNGHHHLANGTNNSDWMYVFELEMNKKLNSWSPLKVSL
ncbi:glycoside hydrolase family 20 zincin-like fold domain-containing protein [Adhaeribacter rhizoryzae]|uniref:beta-N-acetylhexosaminidase n=1 Tax=Adhaeribacter rhizoryzae TaxID=2607907 RepID=A0A5M6DFD9_9BACT|nr:glycoside hydrolase family 20 zincin-like fold domain-containing protein [Adhaeribacter rhizoryzae]KAA5544982.1 family 20 glycosylhydrolase [Adhaeribacter rhizoryzae]